MGVSSADTLPRSDFANGETAINDSATLEYMQATFSDHYKNKRCVMSIFVPFSAGVLIDHVRTGSRSACTRTLSISPCVPLSSHARLPSPD